MSSTTTSLYSCYLSRVIESCHCMLPVRFSLQERLYLWLVLTGAFLLVYHCDTLKLMQLHRNIFNRFKSGDQADKATVPFLAKHLASQLRVKEIRCRSAETRKRAVVLWPHVARVTRYRLNPEVTHFPRNCL
jgi:hypothetical protein